MLGALNEGRGISPGDTRDKQNLQQDKVRSTKAGASAPATRGTNKTCNRTRCAQRRPGHQPRRHRRDRSKRRLDAHRSTKAGASAPATPERYLESCPPRSALNEGRGISPGDTAGRAGMSDAVRALNEGRGISPGDTRHAAVPTPTGVGRSTKAGASAPATLLNSAKGRYRGGTALFHGCGSLDDDAFAAISRDFGRYPVRMVGIKQSRLPRPRPSTRGFRESLRVRR